MTEIKIHVLHTGSVVVDEALPFHRKDDRFLAWTGLFRSKKHLITVPVSTYLIEHPKGLVLIDTGWHSINRTNQLKNLLFQYPANKAILPKGQAIDEKLAKLGYKPSDLDYVVMSHLHCDHADGLRLVKDAKKILVSEEEFQAAKKDRLRYLPHEWKGVDLKTFELKNTGIGPKGKSFDLFGDGTITFVLTPGHSLGLCATIVKNNNDEFILLASDVGYAEKSWKENLTPGVVVNREDAEISLNWIKTMAKDKNCKLVLANHDPNISEQIIVLK